MDQLTNGGRQLADVVLGEHELLEGDAAPDVEVERGQAVLVDLEDGQLGQVTDRVWQELDGVLAQVQVGEAAEAADLDRDVLQAIFRDVQATQIM